MKKVLLAAALATAMAGASAQEAAGGSEAAESTFGGMATQDIVAGAVAVGVLTAIIVNANDDGAKRPEPPGPTPCPDGFELNDDGICVEIPVPQPECNEGDVFDGTYCIGTDVTVTVSGTTTIEVPVTFTYLPTIAE